MQGGLRRADGLCSSIDDAAVRQETNISEGIPKSGRVDRQDKTLEIFNGSVDPKNSTRNIE